MIKKTDAKSPNQSTKRQKLVARSRVINLVMVLIKLMTKVYGVYQKQQTWIELTFFRADFCFHKDKLAFYLFKRLDRRPTIKNYLISFNAQLQKLLLIHRCKKLMPHTGLLGLGAFQILR